MFRNYLAAALRNFSRNRLMASLNIAGLAVGLAAALLALLYIRYELSYDKFIPGHERLMILQTEAGPKGQAPLISDITPWYFAGWLREDFPNIQLTRLTQREFSVRKGDNENIEKIGFGDPNLFDLLPLPVVAGDLSTALERPDALVLTRRMARKYFGRDVPIGETLEFERKQPFQVVAIIEDLPEATHLAPEIYASTRNREFGLAQIDEQPYREGTININVQTYIAAPPGSDPAEKVAEMHNAMPDFILRHMKQLVTTTFDVKIHAVPLDRLHLTNVNLAIMKPHGSLTALYAAGGAAVLIILIATINFINLMTARSNRRAVEVGVRKATGAAMQQLMTQFLIESLIYALLAAAIALGLTKLLLMPIDNLLVPGMQAAGIGFAALGLLAALALAIGLLGGFYPAFVLSSFRPATVLKGSAVQASGSGMVRQGLVVLQFSLLIGLIVATLIVYRQTMFGLRDGLRVAHDQVVLVFGPCRGAFLDELRNLKGVRGVACSAPNPLNIGQNDTSVTRPDGAQISMTIAPVGFGWFELYGIAPIAGRLFDEAHGGDAAPMPPPPVPGQPQPPPPAFQGTLVLNESSVRRLGFETPAKAIGQHVQFQLGPNVGPPAEVIGVVPDFAFDLMNRPVASLLYFIVPQAQSVLNVKLTGQQVPETLDAIDALWKRIGEPRPIRRQFLDQRIQDLYGEIIRQGQVIGGLSAVAIFIACLGLFGLSAFTAERRTKEIGIRKAMGAASPNILGLLLWQFAKPVLWANLIAWPAAFFLMDRWLRGFAYHIELAVWMFAIAGSAALAIALLTVSAHSWIVARTKPILALRYE